MTSAEVRDCQRCTARNRDNRQCARKTCKIAHVCWQHLKSLFHLQVKKSTIAGAGLGLFTTEPIKVKKGGTKRIVQYSAHNRYTKRLSERDVGRIYGDALAVYVWCKNKNECYDAKSTQSTNARRANACDRPGHRRPCNARITHGGYIVAQKSIPKGGEIFVSYGPEYWKQR